MRRSKIIRIQASISTYTQERELRKYLGRTLGMVKNEVIVLLGLLDSYE
jgi:hypothetical protein